jgi:hypothetical protein
MTFNSYFVYNAIQDFIPNNFSMRRNRIEDNLSKTNAPYGNPNRDLFSNLLTSTDIILPFSRVDHISSSQYYSTGASFTSQNLTAPIVLNLTSANTFTLPSASALLNIFGNVNVNLNLLPIQTSDISQVQTAQATQTQNQIQVGDFYIIKVLSLGTALSTILPGTNGTIFGGGTKTIPIYSAINEMYNLIVIRFTSTSIYTPSYVVY